MLLAIILCPVAAYAESADEAMPGWVAFGEGKSLADYIPDSEASRRATAWAMLRRQGVEHVQVRPSILAASTYVLLNMFAGVGGAMDVVTVRPDLNKVDEQSNME